MGHFVASIMATVPLFLSFVGKNASASFLRISTKHVGWATQNAPVPVALTAKGRPLSSRTNRKKIHPKTKSRSFRSNAKRNSGVGSPSSFSSSHRRSTFRSLAEPSILFSNNHLLVVNKPAGWHSVPNENSSTKKCMLSKLKSDGLGGGSSKDFLLPMHRIDQPCTGALLYAKNSKAGTRIGKAWKKGLVEKEYLCVVEGSLADMVRGSTQSLREGKKIGGNKFSSTSNSDFDRRCDGGDDSNTMFTMSGILRRRNVGKSDRASGRSVTVAPLGNNNIESAHTLKGARVCHLQWRHVCGVVPTMTRKTEGRSPLELIQVRTSTGARHQIRAMLAQLTASPIAGDLRYGSVGGALPDQSVALHARRLFLPTVKLGETDLSQPFLAPIPQPWLEFFGLKEDFVLAREATCGTIR